LPRNEERKKEGGTSSAAVMMQESSRGGGGTALLVDATKLRNQIIPQSKGSQISSESLW
jgi:hypothetical protein